MTDIDADSDTAIDSKTRITRPGRYTLARDIERGGGTFISEPCILIESSNVVLDGRGYTIDGRGVSDTTGVAVTSSTGLVNVTVTNVTISDWDRGLFFENVGGGVVHDVDVVDNGYGISLENTSGVLVTGSRIRDNLLGVSLDPRSDDTVLWNNTIESNHGHDVFRQSEYFE